MDLPSELVYMVISYNPRPKFRQVSKNWKNEIDTIRKPVETIEKWYKKRKARDDYDTIKELVRWYVVHYPNEFFMTYPEFTVNKLRLNNTLLDVLPPLDTRKRSDVRDWMLNMPISVNDWANVGW